MKYEIKFKGFSAEEEGFIHHDFLILLRDEVKLHLEVAAGHSMEMIVSNQEGKITFKKATV